MIKHTLFKLWARKMTLAIVNAKILDSNGIPIAPYILLHIMRTACKAGQLKIVQFVLENMDCDVPTMVTELLQIASDNRDLRMTHFLQSMEKSKKY